MEAQLAAGVIAALVLAVVVAGVVGRTLRRRRLRASDAAMRESERVAIERLAWLTGRSAQAPEAPAPPPPPRHAERPAGRAATAPAEGWVVSPRRRLWRDTAAVLLVAAIGVLAVGFVLPPAPPADGGVLGATATPQPATPAAPTPPAPAPTPTPGPTVKAAPQPAPTPTPRPTTTPGVVTPPPAPTQQP